MRVAETVPITPQAALQIDGALSEAIHVACDGYFASLCGLRPYFLQHPVWSTERLCIRCQDFIVSHRLLEEEPTQTELKL